MEAAQSSCVSQQLSAKRDAAQIQRTLDALPNDPMHQTLRHRLLSGNFGATCKLAELERIASPKPLL